MTPADFRAALARLELSQSEFARRLATLGDERPYATRLRTVQALASGNRGTLPWAVAALVTLMERDGVA